MSHEQASRRPPEGLQSGVLTARNYSLPAGIGKVYKAERHKGIQLLLGGA